MRAACTLFILKNYYKYKTGFLAVVIKPTALAYTGNNLILNRPQFAGGSKVSMDGAYGKK